MHNHTPKLMHRVGRMEGQLTNLLPLIKHIHRQNGRIEKRLVVLEQFQEKRRIFMAISLWGASLLGSLGSDLLTYLF